MHREFNVLHVAIMQLKLFVNSFKLGKNMNLDAIEARYEHGILLVKLPKLAEAQEKPSREIAIG